MRFAKIVFLIAGVWGLVIVTPLYFMYDTIGRQYPPPLTHPDIYYGFIAVTLAWQVAFLVISSDPVRLRPLMMAAMLEKFGYVVTLTALYRGGHLQLGQYALAGPDFLLGILFVAAFLKTGHSAAVAGASPRRHEATMPRR
jgi:hypothetical protein